MAGINTLPVKVDDGCSCGHIKSPPIARAVKAERSASRALMLYRENGTHAGEEAAVTS